MSAQQADASALGTSTGGRTGPTTTSVADTGPEVAQIGGAVLGHAQRGSGADHWR